MAKLRHIAIAVSNAAEAAKFYEHAFGMQRVRESTSAVLLSDGVISLAILDNKESHEALGASGLHHFGVIADSVDESLFDIRIPVFAASNGSARDKAGVNGFGDVSRKTLVFLKPCDHEREVVAAQRCRDSLQTVLIPVVTHGYASLNAPLRRNGPE